jgi:hypothetical protein
VQGIYGYRPPTDIELNGLQPRRLLQTIEIRKSPGGGSQCSLHEETPTDTNASHKHAIAESAFEALKRLIVYLRGQLNGTVAAIDRSQGAALNYDQVTFSVPVKALAVLSISIPTCFESIIIVNGSRPNNPDGEY